MIGAFIHLEGRQAHLGYVICENGCWEWTGSRDKGGYGRIDIRSVSTLVHRFFYERDKGPIPEGQEIDHLCRNRICCNPAHLEAVSPKENRLRGVGACAGFARRTHCKRGHELGGENAVPYWIKQGSRTCLECKRLNARKTYWRKKERAA